MNPGQLGVLFAQHKTAILGAGAAGAVLLGLRARKKGAATPAGTPRPAGSLPAAAVVPGDQLAAAGGGGMSSSDAYALQDELSKFVEQQQKAVTGQTGVTDLPPIASALFAPTGSGNYVHYNNGTVAEVESDGSQLGLSWGQWQPLRDKGAKPSVEIAGPAVGQFYTTAGNIAAKKPPTAAA